METGLHQLKIVSIRTETDHAKTFVLEPVDDWKPFYKPGQFLTLVFFTKFGEKRRSYSMSSSPALDEPLSITVKKVDNGEFSRWLLYEAKEGMILHTSGISGFFTLPEDLEETDQLFFLAAGSGITPCYSIIKTLLATTNKQVVLIYSNHHENDTIFFNELQELQYTHQSTFQLHFVQSQHGRRLSKWLLNILLKEYLRTEKTNTLFYLCGPFEYMQMIQISLLIEGIENDKIRKEIFTPLPPLNIPHPSDTTPHTVFIHLNGHHYKLTVQYPKTILATAKEKNISIPYSCEAGICGTCAATCLKGKVWMLYNGVLMDKEIEEGRVLTCQGFPIGGDVELTF
ncbi:MAG TPA: iron-sulfur cluster-binding domain-containing protein [Cytophagaceae bacterium]|nr:iron-sulfur cluster-binding domain-containing protein [Cytophagaceae bacterium]